MEKENLNASSSIPLRKRARDTEEEIQDEINNKNADFDIAPEAKRICSAPAQDADLMALLDKIDKMDDYTEEEQLLTNPTEEEMSLKDLSSFNGDVENEFNFYLFLDELHMNYFDLCDEDLMAVYSAANYDLLHDYMEVPMSLWEDDIWQ
ncbi:hypothetical protein SUGI_1033190 [Cryptomeria japonica]|nr:hypothetical protein SUGI_1033190 [Cryptomeria japonica]